MEPVTGVAAILQAMSTILTALLTSATSLTTWILGDDLAVMFFGIMMIMLCIHVLRSIVHQFS